MYNQQHFNLQLVRQLLTSVIPRPKSCHPRLVDTPCPANDMTVMYVFLKETCCFRGTMYFRPFPLKKALLQQRPTKIIFYLWFRSYTLKKLWLVDLFQCYCISFLIYLYIYFLKNTDTSDDHASLSRLPHKVIAKYLRTV